MAGRRSSFGVARSLGSALMSALENLLRATSWEQVSGTPLGCDALEYRNLFVGEECIACHVFHKTESMDLQEVQARLRGAPA